MTTTDNYTKITVTGSGGIAVLTLASDKVNALDVATLSEIALYLDRAAPDPAVRALVVTGAGSIFSAGLNVSEVLDHEKDRTGVLLDALRDALVGLFRFPKPTVAAINGPAIAGGCILACACDKRLIAEGARIGATELKVGVSFPVFAVELLRHACGSAAEQLMFDAALLNAEEACACGLVHQVVTADALAATATDLAAQLAG
jgi:enoyl-CoA hydratase/carnithine racemase